MKGTFFQKPFEFKLNVEGESWRQSQEISGVLTAKNHGSDAIPANGIRVHLAYGQLKKVREKSPDAFEILQTAEPRDTASLAPQGELQFNWKFPTELNSPISDSSASLFLLYGQSTETDKLGQLQLTVLPSEIIQEFLDTITVQFRFVQKTIKSSKGRVEAKLVPPTAKSFAMVEHLIVSFRFVSETLETEYSFQVKKIEPGAGTMGIKKDKVKLSQSYTAAQLRLPSGRINHEILEAGIREALSQVESKIVY